MKSYAGSVVVEFADEPNEDHLSDLNVALALYNPRDTDGAGSWVRNASGSITIHVMIEAADDEAARTETRQTVSSALFDIGHTIDSARLDERLIAVEPRES
jgi:hypothetical protein